MWLDGYIAMISVYTFNDWENYSSDSGLHISNPTSPGHLSDARNFSNSCREIFSTVPCLRPRGIVSLSEMSVQFTRSLDSSIPYRCSVYLSKYISHLSPLLITVGPSAQ